MDQQLVTRLFEQYQSNVAVDRKRLDGSIENTFPGSGAFSAFANVTMETYDQKGVQLGCMSCHNRARMTTDFMWSVFDHAYPSRLAPGPPP